MFFVAIVLGLAATGALYEWLAARGDAQRYPAPGQIVTVDGASLHIICSGSGGPTVVFESGLGDSALVWARVQQRLTPNVRVCSYDRAGIAWSAGGGAWDWKTGVEQLRSALAAIGEKPPYVLVGHSSGANYVLLFALEHPDEVVGIVLIEPPLLKSVPPAAVAGLKAARIGIGALARLGIVRMLGRIGWTKLLTAGSTPPREFEESVGFLYRPESIRASMREIDALPETIRALTLRSGPGLLGDVPVRVVAAQHAADGPRALKLALQKIAQLSSRGQVVMMQGSHFLQYDHPDRIADIVLGVVQEARQ